MSSVLQFIFEKKRSLGFCFCVWTKNVPKLLLTNVVIWYNLYPFNTFCLIKDVRAEKRPHEWLGGGLRSVWIGSLSPHILDWAKGVKGISGALIGWTRVHRKSESLGFPIFDIWLKPEVIYFLRYFDFKRLIKLIFLLNNCIIFLV